MGNEDEQEEASYVEVRRRTLPEQMRWWAEQLGQASEQLEGRNRTVVVGASLFLLTLEEKLEALPALAELLEMGGVAGSEEHAAGLVFKHFPGSRFEEGEQI